MSSKRKASSSPSPPPSSTTTDKAGGQKKAGRGRPKGPPKYWFDLNDPFEVSSSGLSFVIRGRPAPWERAMNVARKWAIKNYTINPSRKGEDEFNSVCKELFQRKGFEIPCIEKGKQVFLKVLFAFPTSEGNIHVRPDLDNLVKFTLDAMGGKRRRTFYHDDGQVTMICAQKELDNRFGGKGFTEVEIGLVENLEEPLFRSAAGGRAAALPATSSKEDSEAKEVIVLEE